MNDKYLEELSYKNLTFSGERFCDCEIIYCTFEDCTFEDCSLVRCKLSENKFINCTISNLKASGNTQSQYNEFIRCSLISVSWAELMPNGKFIEPIRALEKCNLKYNTFSDVNFKKFQFKNCEIIDSMFAECNLSESVFNNCKLGKTEFYNCDLKKADFRKATGYNIDVLKNKVFGARFSSPEALNLLLSLGIRLD